MNVTRREFIGYAAASMAMRAFRRSPLGTRAEPNRGVVVLGDHCRNPESLAGYESVLSSSRITGDSVVILPAATTIPPVTVRFLHDRLRRGATIILESGAGFLDVRSDEFQRHRALVDKAFGIRIDSPVGLWPGHGIPYVEYSWPRPALIRDYSRVIPITSQSGEVIATASGLPVALKRHWRRGTLIFLGAPLGPSLLFGDAQARQWLGHCLTTAMWAAHHPSAAAS